MTVSVRQADRVDFTTVIALIAALADYEQLSPPDAVAQARLKEHGWPEDGSDGRFKVWLAEVSNADGAMAQAVAYAITFETYSSFLARPTLYIEDIFVLPEFRRGGVGTALFAHLEAEARAGDCGRIEWVVLDWNTSAQQFYQRHGAQHLNEWQYYRLVLDGPPAEISTEHPNP
jgi:GNAT superfamily N-acetyltransferase